MKVHIQPTEGEKKTFQLHHNFIVAQSRYFKAAFNSSFIEGETQEVLLEDADPKIFGLFATWIYNGKIKVDYRRLDACGLLIELWLFCDRIIAPKLQNKTLELLDEARESRGALPTTHLRQIYENTTPESVLRKYLQFVWNNDVVCSDDIEELFPYQLLLEIVASEHLRRKNKGIFLIDRLPGVELEKFFVDENSDPARRGEKRKRTASPKLSMSRSSKEPTPLKKAPGWADENAFNNHFDENEGWS